MPSSKLYGLEVVIVTFSRQELLKALLLSLPSTGIERVTIVINGPDHSTHQLINSMAQSHFHMIHCPVAMSPAAARNLALKNSSAEWLLFLDDDVLLPPGYIERAFTFISNHPKAIAFGGNDSAYPNCSTWELSLNLTLTSILATAHTRYRHGPERATTHRLAQESDLTLCNLWIKNNLLKEHHLTFNESFYRNEENVLLDEIGRYNKEIYRCHDLFVYHRRRPHLFAAMKSVFRSGQYRLKSLIKSRKIKNILHIIPLAALLFFIASLMSNPLVFTVGLLMIYLVVVSFVSLKVAQKHQRIDLYGHILLNHIGINLAYALGSLWGIVTFPIMMKKN